MPSRLLAVAALVALAGACVSDFPAISPVDPETRGPNDVGLDRGSLDRGLADQGGVDGTVVADRGVRLDRALAEPEPAPNPAPQPDTDPDLSADLGLPMDAAAPDLGVAPFIAFDQVAAGRNFTCARRLADRVVVCWGENNRGQTNAPAVALDPFGLGYDQGCGYDPAGFVIRCWGLNDINQAEPGTFALTVEQFSGGQRITCGLTAVAFACQGDPALQQFGGPLSSIAVGETHACGYPKFQEDPRCWGSDADGRHAIPADIRLIRDSLAASRTQTCALVAGANTIACWGPGADPPLGFYRKIFPSAGDHLCAIDLTNQAVCWGENGQGQAIPPANATFTQLAAGAQHTCGLEFSGRVRCWGANDVGQLQVPVP